MKVNNFFSALVTWLALVKKKLNKKIIFAGLITVGGILALVLALTINSSDLIFANGSTTVQPLMLDLADQYHQDEPKSTGIAVSGGGSSLGINFLLNKETDIAMASRFANEEEYTGSSWQHLHTCPIGIDSLTVVANLPIASTSNYHLTLTTDDLIKIYSGQITTWGQISDATRSTEFPSSIRNLKITPVNRELGSGTRDSFYNGLNRYISLSNSSVSPLNAVDFPSNGLVASSNGAAENYLTVRTGTIAYISLRFVKNFYNFNGNGAKTNSNIHLASLANDLVGDFESNQVDFIDNSEIDQTFNETSFNSYLSTLAASIINPFSIETNKTNLFYHPLNLIYNDQSSVVTKITTFLNWVYDPDTQSLISGQGYLPMYSAWFPEQSNASNYLSIPTFNGDVPTLIDQSAWEAEIINKTDLDKFYDINSSSPWWSQWLTRVEQ